MQAAAAKAHDTAMRTITIMLPVRYNEAPPAPPDFHQHAMMPPPGVEPGPRHGPLNGQLLGALSHEPPFVVSRWSATFDAPPPGVDGGPPAAASGTDQDSKSAKHSMSSSLGPGFLFNLLTGARYQPPPPAETPEMTRSAANEIQRQRAKSAAAAAAGPEVEWRPAQLLQRYVELQRGGARLGGALRRDGPARGDTVLKNNVVMTAVAYGLLGRDQPRPDSATPQTTSTTTPATTNANRKRKFPAAAYRHRASGRYRPYEYPSRRRPPMRRVSDFDLTLDSDDEDDEVLEALFGYDRSPTSFRRVRRPSPASARRVYGRKRLGNGRGGDRRRRWRPRGDVPAGKFPRRTGGDRQRQAVRSRRPETAHPYRKPTKPDVGPADMDSSRRLSLLHIVVSRQQDFAPPQPAVEFADGPGLSLEPRPLDVDALHSLSRHPFIQPFSPFLPVKPIIPDRHLHQLQDRYLVSAEDYL